MSKYIVCAICAYGAGKDLGVYDVLRSWGNYDIREAYLRSGSYCGSLFLDLRFRKLVCSTLSRYPSHLDEASLAHFTLTFGKVKLEYSGLAEDDTNFHFGCLHRQHSGRSLVAYCMSLVGIDDFS